MSQAEFLLNILGSIIAAILVKLGEIFIIKPARHLPTIVEKAWIITSPSVKMHVAGLILAPLFLLAVLSVSTETALAPSLYTKILVSNDSDHLQRIMYSVWKSERTGKTYIFVTDGDPDNPTFLDTLDSGS